jgi:hypothetical protein
VWYGEVLWFCVLYCHMSDMYRFSPSCIACMRSHVNTDLGGAVYARMYTRLGRGDAGTRWILGSVVTWFGYQAKVFASDVQLVVCVETELRNIIRRDSFKSSC